MFDLILKNGLIVDPLNGTNEVGDLAVKEGKIEMIGHDLSNAKEIEDCQGKLVMPGLIDAHMHFGSVYGSMHGVRMTALAGVTTCLDMAGPLDEVLKTTKRSGAGITFGIVDRYDPNSMHGTASPSDKQITEWTHSHTEGGALGVKLVGGHWPLDPATCHKVIELCNEENLYVAWYAGSTNNKSDILGMREAVEVADGMRLHLAHINSYCRGRVRTAQSEADEAIELLKTNPKLWSEAYLSPLNGTHLSCNENGEALDYVTKMCLELFRLPATADGIRQAFRKGILATLHDNGYVTEAVYGAAAEKLWEDAGTTNVVGCFPVNSAVSRLMLASAKREDGSFVVDAFSTDGGCIPRNVIIPMGLALVKFGALTLSEFVAKASLNTARHLRLFDRGHFTPGAVADVTVVDMDKGEAVSSFRDGKLNMKDGKLYPTPVRIITTSRGEKAIREAGYEPIVIDLSTPEPERVNQF